MRQSNKMVVFFFLSTMNKMVVCSSDLFREYYWGTIFTYKSDMLYLVLLSNMRICSGYASKFSHSLTCMINLGMLFFLNKAVGWLCQASIYII